MTVDAAEHGRAIKRTVCCKDDFAYRIGAVGLRWSKRVQESEDAGAVQSMDRAESVVAAHARRSVQIAVGSLNRGALRKYPTPVRLFLARYSRRILSFPRRPLVSRRSAPTRRIHPQALDVTAPMRQGAGDPHVTTRSLLEEAPLFSATPVVAMLAAVIFAGLASNVVAFRARIAAAQPAGSRIALAANLVYSPVERRVLAVNGSEDFKTEIATRIWSWDGRRWTALEGAGPRVRNLAAAVFDAARGELLLLGGIRPGESQDDMWAWKKGTWRELSSGFGPRDHHVMAYDSHRGRTVLFGGTGPRPPGAERRVSPVDTWEWDGTRWTQIATSGPSSRGRSAMVYDERRRQMVLFGGGGNVILGDTWLWDGHAWREVVGPAPPARYAHAMAYDSHRGVTILYGGSSAYKPARYLTDMWEWDGQTWREIQLPAVNPGMRYSPGMAYDRNRRRLVLHGGIQQPERGQAHYVFDTWEWDGRRWSQ